MKTDHFDQVVDKKISTDWDKILRAQVKLYADAELDFLIGQNLIPKERPLLDLGCGNGAWTHQLLNRVPDIRIIATDGNAMLLEDFKKSLPTAFHERVKIIPWKVGVDPVPNNIGNCGLVILRYVLQHQQDPTEFLSLVTRPLQTGSKIVIIEDDDPLFAMDPDMQEFRDVFRFQKKWAEKFNSVDDMGRHCANIIQTLGLKLKTVRMLGQSSLEKGLKEFCEFYSVTLDMIQKSTPDILSEEQRQDLQHRLRQVPNTYPNGIVVHPQIITVAEI